MDHLQDEETQSSLQYHVTVERKDEKGKETLPYAMQINFLEEVKLELMIP